MKRHELLDFGDGKFIIKHKKDKYYITIEIVPVKVENRIVSNHLVFYSIHRFGNILPKLEEKNYSEVDEIKVILEELKKELDKKTYREIESILIMIPLLKNSLTNNFYKSIKLAEDVFHVLVNGKVGT